MINLKLAGSNFQYNFYSYLSSHYKIHIHDYLQTTQSFSDPLTVVNYLRLIYLSVSMFENWKPTPYP